MMFVLAPVPRFQTNAIDALIKPAMNDLATPQMEPATAATLSKSALGSTGAWPSATQATRNSWIDTTTTTARPHQQQQAQQQQQQPQRPTSWYVGQPAMQQPVDVFVPSAPFMSPPQQAPPRQQQQQSSVTSSSCQSQHNSESSSTAGSSSQQQFNHGYQNQQQPQHIQQGTAPSAQHPWGQLPLQPTTSAAVPTKTDTQKYTHSRSRSVPYSVPQPPIQTEPKTSGEQENLFVFDTVAATPTKQQQQQQRPAPLTSRVSMDADSFQKLSSAIDTGQSLLLTKKFVPPKASNNPFESAIEESPKKEPVTALTYSPFADDVQQPLPQQQQQPNQQQQQQNQSSAAAAADPTIAFPDTPPRQDSVDSPQASAPPWPISKTNDHPNKHNIYPPPVPPQATKPAFLKYARNVVPPSYLRRTRSYGTRDRAPSDPFNSNDTTSFITTTTTTTTNTTFNYNDIATPTASSSSTASPFYSTEPHFGTKLFRHRSDGSSLIRR
ncbi:hypothetical protein BDB00DRAFT_214262 [Zychaea mexicana]|uniref:uncharacterized protein n=1 Tax=Zychaea mexicana TaxID=64656 RepID=UPI0022FE453D|nr:uncharacterized protein BDB00DRAFT_214262 [Zychaea mexicana]KAI9495752.1 hypothetical protein BDB00DRAFT_214262 [Zychaea mexicana]